MTESYNIKKILEAIDDLNNKTKIVKNLTRYKVLKNDDVPPQVDLIIREAEQYKNKFLSNLKTENEFSNLKISEFKKEKNILLDEKNKLEKKIKEMEINYKKEISNLKTKLEHQTIFYKENYEKIIIENNDIKLRLENTKKQINSFQEIKSEIITAISKLNKTLSKSEIIGSIAPINFSSTENIKKLNLEKNKKTKD